LLKEKISGYIEKADRLVRQNRLLDTLNQYNEINRLSRRFPEFQTYVQGRIRRLDRKLKSGDRIQRAATYEQRGDYAAAAGLYKEALSFEPDNQALKKRYEENNARANAKKMKMTPEVKRLYSEGFKYFRAKEFQKATELFEKALRLQPLNKDILDAIDRTKQELDKAGR